MRTVIDTAEAVRRGDLAAVNVLDECLAAIENRNAAARALTAEAGLTMVDIDVCFDDLIPIWAQLESVDRWVGLPPGLWPDRADDLDPGVRRVDRGPAHRVAHRRQPSRRRRGAATRPHPGPIPAMAEALPRS